jgi:iron complex transport system substrate-binding protein
MILPFLAAFLATFPARAARPRSAESAPPTRIAALAPSCAEILYALGAGPRVLGVSDFAARLPESAGKERLGGFAPDLERIARLAPDLIVVSKDGTDLAAMRRLESLGYRIAVTRGNSLDGVLEDVEIVGRAIGEPERAAELVKSLRARIAAAERAGRRDHPTAVVLVWPDPPIVAGPDTFVGDLLSRAGVVNAVPKSAGLWPRVSYETLAAWNPGVVIRPETPENHDAFATAFGPAGRWRVVPAVREGRVLVMPGDLLERPGPRLVDALERLVEALAKARP